MYVSPRSVYSLLARLMSLSRWKHYALNHHPDIDKVIVRGRLPFRGRPSATAPGVPMWPRRGPDPASFRGRIGVRTTHVFKPSEGNPPARKLGSGTHAGHPPTHRATFMGVARGQLEVRSRPFVPKGCGSGHRFGRCCMAPALRQRTRLAIFKVPMRFGGFAPGPTKSAARPRSAPEQHSRPDPIPERLLGDKLRLIALQACHGRRM